HYFNSNSRSPGEPRLAHVSSIAGAVDTFGHPPRKEKKKKRYTSELGQSEAARWGPPQITGHFAQPRRFGLPLQDDMSGQRNALHGERCPSGNVLPTRGGSTPSDRGDGAGTALALADVNWRLLRLSPLCQRGQRLEQQ